MVFLNTLSVAAEAPLDASAADSMATAGFTQTAIKLSPVFSPAVRVCGELRACVWVTATHAPHVPRDAWPPRVYDGTSAALPRNGGR